jgi:hypothetical protein
VPGGIAQLGEHLLCKQGVVGSIPSASTNHQREGLGRRWAHRSEPLSLAIEPVSAIGSYRLSIFNNLEEVVMDIGRV